VSVRVVPNDAGPHRGQLGAFLAMEFLGASPVVLVELLRSSVFMDEDWQTGAYLETVPRLSAVALSETESARLITGIQARWKDHGRAGQLEEIQP
jgi:predicted nucleic acid-binding protein